MTGYAGRLFLLAFDHRASFTRDLFGLSDAPTPAEAQLISAAKEIIYEGFSHALADGAPRDEAGILVDETFGGEVARRARAAGVMFAMPVEASGKRVFEFEYGDDFGEHIERFDPTFAKVLVRYNPDDGQENAVQLERLKRLSDWLHARRRLFLFELLVPPTAAQRAMAAGDLDRYDRELRPPLMVRAMAELQTAGVEPDIWKIEGLDARADAERVVAQARADGRGRAACIVLGRGASEERVAHWLRTAAPVPGFVGFAVGRTIWQEPLKAFRDGAIDREAATERLAAGYLRAIAVYSDAAASENGRTGGDDANGSGGLR